MKSVFYFLIFFTCIYATCHKQWDCSQTVYSFEGNYKAYPNFDSIHINDTIWLELNMSTQLKDLLTGQVIDYSGAENLGMAMGYLELIGGSFSDPGSIPAANNFNNVLIKGRELPSLSPEQTRAFRFIEENGIYKFKLGVVPKKKGLFAIGPGNSANVYTSKNKCAKAGFNLTFNDTDQHIYLYELSRPGYTPSEYERTHIYCFKVY